MAHGTRGRTVTRRPAATRRALAARLLLPALHALQSRIGWISQPALNYVCRRLTVAPAEAYGVATFYALLSTTPRPPVVAHVCDDIACRLAGAERICADLARALGPAGEPARDGRATWLRSPCLGLCERAPAALFTIAGETPRTTRSRRSMPPAMAGLLEADHRARAHAPRTDGARRRASARAAPGAGRRRRPDLARRLTAPTAGTTR